MIALRDELAAQAEGLRNGATAPSGGISFGNRVGEGTSIAIERFADVAIHDQIVHQLAQVDAALERLDDGTYGICTGCGRPISSERLEAVPWAATCVTSRVTAELQQLLPLHDEVPWPEQPNGHPFDRSGQAEARPKPDEQPRHVTIDRLQHEGPGRAVGKWSCGRGSSTRAGSPAMVTIDR